MQFDSIGGRGAGGSSGTCYSDAGTGSDIDREDRKTPKDLAHVQNHIADVVQQLSETLHPISLPRGWLME